jgi:hypothetical protein
LDQKAQYAQIEATLKEQLDAKEIEDNRKKLAILKADLQAAYRERESLIREKAQAEALLSDEQLQEARDNAKKTDIENIQEDRLLNLNAAQIELQDLQTQQDAKLDLLKDYYYNALVLRKEFLKKF